MRPNHRDTKSAPSRPRDASACDIVIAKAKTKSPIAIDDLETDRKSNILKPN